MPFIIVGEPKSTVFCIPTAFSAYSWLEMGLFRIADPQSFPPATRIRLRTSKMVPILFFPMIYRAVA
jgi:hypothetical protein